MQGKQLEQSAHAFYHLLSLVFFMRQKISLIGAMLASINPVTFSGEENDKG